MSSADRVVPGGSEGFKKAFREYIARAGLKSTRQRDMIVAEFALVEGHVSVDELLSRVRRREGAIGYATVYRTLKLLSDAGLAAARNFGEGFARYEPITGDHHDHLVCDFCGRIEEFHDDLLEQRQEELAHRMGFELTHHRHDLFGACPDCRQQHDVVAEEDRPDDRDLLVVFNEYLSREGLKKTHQREVIARLFAGIDDHLSVDDLLERVRAEDRTIGYATVYRTLKLLVDAGLASCRHFGDGFTRFEPRAEAHHDHLIDEETGEVREFHDEAIERRQEAIAEEHGFLLTRHRHDLFGRRKTSSRSQ